MPDNYCQLEWVQLWHFQLTISSSYLKQKLYSKKFLNSNIFRFVMTSQFKKYKSKDPKVLLYVIIVLSCSKKATIRGGFWDPRICTFKIFLLVHFRNFLKLSFLANFMYIIFLVTGAIILKYMAGLHKFSFIFTNLLFNILCT